MPHFYLDTSALLKRYHDEAGSEFINELYNFQKRNHEKLYASVLTGIEFCSAIRRHQRESKFNENIANGILSAFLEESEAMLLTIPVSKQVISFAIKLLSDHPLRAYDAVQLASGIEVNEYLSRVDDFFFVCDDDRLCYAAEMEGLKVLKPRFSDFPGNINH